MYLRPVPVSRLALQFWLSGVSAYEDQTKLFALLRPEENIGVRLTSTSLLEPEQITSAIVVHHPNAKYFVVQEVVGVIGIRLPTGCR